MSRQGKMHRCSKFRASGKFKRQFERTVKRLGRWRGKIKSLLDVAK